MSAAADGDGMSIRNLQSLFAPKTVVVIGASERVGRLGSVVWKNCVAGGFEGTLLPVNPKYSHLDERACYRHVRDLPANVDLALVCTHPSSIVDVLTELAKKAIKAVVVLSELSAIPEDERSALEQAMREAAKPTLMRILGPGTFGLQVPKIKLRTGAYSSPILAGDLAFVSQSASVTVGILEWAKERDIGFSKVVSLGASTDVDMGDVLDYLASDGETKAVLLYIEKIEHARKFLSAARAAARSKPVIVIMPKGHNEDESQTTAICTDAIYDAVFRRAGALRVASMVDLFAAAETLTYARNVYGERLSIVTNGRELGLLAADALVSAGGQIATLKAVEDFRYFEANSTSTDIDSEPYVTALTAALQDRSNDCVLLIHSPMSISSTEALADAIIPQMRHASHCLLTCWMGAESSTMRHQLALAKIPVFDTPEQAAHGFMQMANYRRTQSLLMQVPESLCNDDLDHRAVVEVIGHVLMQNRRLLSDEEAQVVLSGYGLHVAQSKDGQSSITICSQVDATFGPVIAISKTDAKGSLMVGLPPLNSVLAADMIAGSGLCASGTGKSILSSQQIEAIEIALINISRLISQVGEAESLNIDLAFSDKEFPAKLIVTRASVEVGSINGSTSERLAIRPYPKEMERKIDWQGQKLTIRPIRLEDGAAHIAFFAALTPEDVHFRMFSNMRELQPAQLARMTQIDYDREMALIATCTDDSGENRTLGVVRVVADPDNEQAEFAVTVRSDLKAHGLGTILMREIIDYCRLRGTKEIVGDALSNNTRLLNMVTKLGFEVTPRIDDDTMMLRLPLQ